MPQDEASMGPTRLLREISVQQLSDFVFTGEDGPTIETACVYRNTKEWRGANCIGCPMPRHDFLPCDGMQGSYEVIEGSC